MEQIQLLNHRNSREILSKPYIYINANDNKCSAAYILQTISSNAVM